MTINFDAIEVNGVKDLAKRGKGVKLLRESHLTVGYGAQPHLLTTGIL